MAKTIPTKPINRSSISGRFVTEGYATRYPHITEHQHIPIHNPKK